MIRFRFGDLFDLLGKDGFKMVAHGCNCQCRMKSGFAGTLVEKYPIAAEIDSKTEKGDITKMGTYSTATVDDISIFNLYTQFNYGTDKVQVDLNAVESAFERLATDLTKQGRNKDILLIPAIGSGLAGGKWYDILRAIDKVTNNLNIMVVFNVIPD